MKIIWNTATDALRGITLSPRTTGFIRGIVEAAVIAGIVAGVSAATSSDAPAALQVWCPLIVLGGRTLEGWADHIDPAKKRAP